MLVAQFELAHRAHHAVACHPTDRGDLQRDVAPRHIGAGRTEHADEAGARIGRAADDLHRPLARVDAQHLELVRLRVALGGEHARDAERREPGRRVLDALDLQPDARERLDDRLQRRVGLKMVLEPGEGELHAPTPPLSVGTSNAAKP